MTRVLLVAAANSTTGGGERHVADLLRELPTHGIELGLVCPPGGDLPVRAKEAGAVVFEAPISAGLTVRGMRAVRHAVHFFAPDIVHAHGSRAALFARLADPRAAERVVYTLHGIHVDKAGSAVRRVAFLALERILKGRTARFVCVCGSDVEKGAKLGLLARDRASVVYNGVETPTPAPPGAFRDELGLAPDDPVALSVGRLHEQKDQRTLLNAWALVHQRMPGAVLALVGSGPLERDVRELAHSLNLGASTCFVRPRPDLAPAYADAGVFVLSSLWEGLPYVVLEAMGHGVPVVSTAVDGVPEAVEDGVTGLLVPAGDPLALAAAVSRVLGEPSLGASMGAAARARIASDFTLDGMVGSLVDLYTRIQKERQ